MVYYGRRCFLFSASISTDEPDDQIAVSRAARGPRGLALDTAP